MIALLVAGIVFFVAGVVAIVFGIPVKEFSFGNTLIMSGAIVVCTGAIIIGLSLVLRELKHIARRLGPPAAATSRSRTEFPFPAASAAGEDEHPAGPSQPEELSSGTGAPPKPVSASVPWQEDVAARDRSRPRAELPPGAANPEAAPSATTAPPAQKPRRNLLFTSSRREKERLAARSPDVAAELPPLPSGSLATSGSEISPRPSFDEAWPQSDRARKEPNPRTPPSFGANSSAGRREAPADVTVLKSGVVDGMAYSLYSDGSIEAQMPEGMMRFASIEALRAHLDQRA